MDFAKSISILVAGELPGRVTHGVVGIAPFGQPTVNVIFIGVDNSSFSNRSFDQRGDRLLLHVREHRDDNLAATLHHTENRRFLLLQRSSAPFPLQPTAAPGPPFFSRMANSTGGVWEHPEMHPLIPILTTLRAHSDRK